MKNSPRIIWIGSVAAVVAATAIGFSVADRRVQVDPPAARSTATAIRNPTSSQPLRIGVPVGLSGANNVVAPTVVQSSQLAIEEINQAGGILGRRVELEIIDDTSSASGAQSAFDTLLQKKVDAIIGMETSAARNAALPIVSRARVPYIYTSFYEGRSCNEWMYVNGWVPEQQVKPVVDYLAKQKSAKAFFLVGSDYAFGRGMLEFARKHIQDTGGRVVGEEYLPTDGSDWATVIGKIRAAKPDALISATAGGAPNVSLARQLRSAGLKIPYGNLSVDESTARTMGDTATGTLVSVSYLTNIETSENKAFLKRMLIKFGASLRAPNELSVPQYEAFHLYKAAVEMAGTTEPEKVIDSLRQVSFTGPRGLVKMDRGRHTPLSMRLGEIRSDGSIKILETFAEVDPGMQCPGTP